MQKGLVGHGMVGYAHWDLFANVLTGMACSAAIDIVHGHILPSITNLRYPDKMNETQK